MNTSGDAAEQIVRLSLEGTEVALKLTGSAAKNIAAMIYTILKNRDKNKTKERFKLATVDTASIKRDIEKNKTEKTAPAAPEQEKPDKAADDRLLDDLLGAPLRKEENSPPTPEAAKTEKSRPSEPISKKQSKTAEGTVKSPEERPSVREELREIRENRQKEAAEPGVPEPTPAKAPKKQQTTTHKQPSRKRTKKSKER